MPVDELDDLLNTRGARYERWGERGVDNLPDLGVRAGRQQRNRRLATGGAALAVTVAVLAGLAGARHQDGSPRRVDFGASSVPTSPSTAPAPAPAPSSSVTASTDPATPTIPPASQTTTSPTTVPSAVPARDIHAVDWRNMTYPADTCGSFGETTPREPYVVRDGRAPVGASGGLGAYVHDATVYGDVTGDGADEAVVRFGCETGGSARWMKVWLYTADAAAAGGVRRLAAVAPFDGMFRGDGVTVLYDARTLESATIAAGRLTTRWSVWADQDPNCCASQHATVTQRWNGRSLVNEAPPIVAAR